MTSLVLRQTLNKPIKGYWNGGPKQIFDWKIDGLPQQDSEGQYIKIGSWDANHWFHVAIGKTDKLTLANARRRLHSAMKKHGITGKFEYIVKEAATNIHSRELEVKEASSDKDAKGRNNQS